MEHRIELYWPVEDREREAEYTLWVHSGKKERVDRIPAGSIIYFYQTEKWPGNRSVTGTKTLFAAGILTDRLPKKPIRFVDNKRRQWVQSRIVKVTTWVPPQEGIALSEIRRVLHKKLRWKMRQGPHPISEEESRQLSALLRAIELRLEGSIPSAGAVVHADMYLRFLRKSGIGGPSSKSYISYLRKASQLLGRSISPEILCSERRVEEICQRLRARLNSKTAKNCRSAMRQYVKMVKEHDLWSGIEAATPPDTSDDSGFRNIAQKDEEASTRQQAKASIEIRKEHNRLINQFSAFCRKVLRIEPEEDKFDALLRIPDSDGALLIEAKSSAAGTFGRHQVRQAIGQLFDYRFTEWKDSSETISLAVLLPHRPLREIRELLQSLHIGMIWQSDQSFYATKDVRQLCESFCQFLDEA